mmetsp:Transcript_30650/g.78628  ORF Transcript_30650/g.78628 Transcript_30650/m.78628 type:complete len:731 (+) Transcript_30650:43-2235(+)
MTGQWTAEVAPCTDIQNINSCSEADDVDGLHASIRELCWKLHKEREDNDYWWQECRRLQEQIRSPASAAEWRQLRLTSPNTTHTEWRRSCADESWIWKHWETACPCCRRPLDVTLVRSEEEDQRPPAPAPPLPAWCELVQDGSELRCCGLQDGYDKTPVFESARAFGVVRTVEHGEVLVAAGPAEVVKGFAMFPVRPCGSVDARFFEPALSVEVEVAAASEEQHTQPVEAQFQSPRYAYCAAIWGANGGYALGAAVLAARLRELSSGVEAAPALVLLHTDDVPSNFLRILEKVWTLRQVEYIDGVAEMYSMKGTAFDGVFTKLAAWGLTEYDKVLLLDIDIVMLKAPIALFDLEAPAALVRGNSRWEHGAAVDGRRFFCGEDGEYPWCQGGGINAGVILLKPSQDTLRRMMAEVTCPAHPEHVKGNGPEQDYLSRFFAWTPWHAMDVRWNYQVHHLPFALEQVIERMRFELDNDCEVDEEEHKKWLPRRLTLDLEDIAIVHFSGDVKPWHSVLDAKQDNDQRRAVEHVPSLWADVETFGSHLLSSCCESHRRWVTRTAAPEEYAYFGCRLGGDGRILLSGRRAAGGAERSVDITPFVDAARERILGTTLRALLDWRRSADRFLAEVSDVVEELRRPLAPRPDCFAPGARVEASWPPPRRPAPEAEEEAAEEEEADDGRPTSWLPAVVVAVHADGRHVVRFEHGGSWGDTERGVPLERLRAASVWGACEPV